MKRERKREMKRERKREMKSERKSEMKRERKREGGGGVGGQGTRERQHLVIVDFKLIRGASSSYCGLMVSVTQVGMVS